MNAVIAPRQAQVGKGCQIRAALVLEYARICELQILVVFTDAQDAYASFGIGIKKRGADPALLLFRPFRHPEQEPCSAFVSESAGIQETFNHHVIPAGFHIGRTHNRIFRKSAYHVFTFVLLTGLKIFPEAGKIYFLYVYLTGYAGALNGTPNSSSALLSFTIKAGLETGVP
jgi:hypothetical protein